MSIEYPKKRPNLFKFELLFQCSVAQTKKILIRNIRLLEFYTSFYIPIVTINSFYLLC